MLSLRYASRWRAAGLMFLIMVLAATLMPAVWFLSDRQDFISWFTNIDKWLHGVTFVFLALWFSGQYERRAYWRIAIGLFFFGVLIELSQRMVAYRSAEWYDLAADVGGIIIGMAIAMAGVGGWSLRAEHWLARRNAGNSVD
jgi:VanZ family protein